MANVINATSTGNGGLITTGDDSGVLNIQTNETTAVSIDASQNATFTNGVNLPNTFGFKNRIINGGMVIDQRNGGASVSVSANYTGMYAVDRFTGIKNGAGVFTVQQSSTAPSGFTNSLVATVTTADASIASDDFAFLNQVIEGYNVADLGFGAAGAATVTVSFWVRSNLTGTYAVALVNGDGNRSFVTNYTINAANTWEQKTVTVTGDTTGTWLKTNGAGMLVRFGLTAGSTFQQAAGSWGTGNAMASSSNVNWLGTVGNNFYITGVQFEKGTQATSFDFRSYGTELALCQRYCQMLSNASGYELGIGGFYGATDLRIPVFLKQTMRNTPSITAPSGTSYYTAYYNGTSVSGPTLQVDGSSSPWYVELQLATTSSATTGVVSLLRTNNSGIVYLSAEF